MKRFSCTNCEGLSELVFLGLKETPRDLIATSDGKFLHEAKVERYFCPCCGCFQIKFSPDDRLEKFFSSEYDLSEVVQNNWIVSSNELRSKHDLLSKQVLELVGKLDGAPRRVLEIACGKGSLISAIQAQNPGWDCWAIDPSLQASLQFQGNSKVRYQKAFFMAGAFDAIKFDLIIAHGLLNRCPTLPHLMKMGELLPKGGVLSLEVLLLENSQFAPHIWDHTHMYSRATFECYLKAAGLEVLKRADCVSTTQFICRKVWEKQTLELGPTVASDSLVLFEGMVRFWRERVEALTKHIQRANGSYGLFGAGLYTAVLLSLMERTPIKFIVDEFRAGRTLLGIPVIGIEAAAEIPFEEILLCVRPSYLSYVQAKLSKNNLRTHPI